MVEEFLSLLENEKEKAYEVLKPQIDRAILKYLAGGFFDEEQKHLVAFALMPVNTDYFWKYDYLFDFSHGHVAILFGSQDEKKPGISLSGPPKKSLQQFIEEGFYHYNLISFYCEYDFNEWNIKTSNCFINGRNKVKIWGSELYKLHGDIKAHFFNRSIFEETKSYYEKRHSSLRASRETHENQPFAEKVYEMKIPVEMRPFVGHSHLVASIRLKKKREVNEAYIAYCQKAFFNPLVVKRKTFHPNEYHEIKPFQFYPCAMLFPDHKRFCLFICLIVNKTKQQRLQFFLYRQEDGKMYEWTYFPPSTYKDQKVSLFTIHKIFEPISQLDDEGYLTNPECTLDDDDFWNNYVLRKEGERFAYLKEIKFSKLD